MSRAPWTARLRPWTPAALLGQEPLPVRPCGVATRVGPAPGTRGRASAGRRTPLGSPSSRCRWSCRTSSRRPSRARTGRHRRRRSIPASPCSDAGPRPGHLKGSCRRRSSAGALQRLAQHRPTRGRLVAGSSESASRSTSGRCRPPRRSRRPWHRHRTCHSRRRPTCSSRRACPASRLVVAPTHSCRSSGCARRRPVGSRPSGRDRPPTADAVRRAGRTRYAPTDRPSGGSAARRPPGWRGIAAALPDRRRPGGGSSPAPGKRAGSPPARRHGRPRGFGTDPDRSPSGPIVAQADEWRRGTVRRALTRCGDRASAPC